MTDKLTAPEMTADSRAGYTEACRAQAHKHDRPTDKLLLARRMCDELLGSGMDLDDVALVGSLLRGEAYSRVKAARAIQRRTAAGRMGLGVPGPLVPRYPAPNTGA